MIVFFILYFIVSVLGFNGPTIPHKHLLSQTFDDLSGFLGGTGRSKTFWENLRIGNDPTLDLGTNGLSPKIRFKIAQATRWKPLVPLTLVPGVEDKASKSGTIKLQFELADNQRIETVLIPWYDYNRTTLCVSTQIGCDRGCKFCLTSTMGIIRNLSSHEIIGQVIKGFETSRKLSMPPLTNVVLMGMGDAGRNPDEVEEAVKCMVDTQRIGLSKNKIMISTVGPTPDSFSRLAKIPAGLAWSLHSANNEIRKKLVPSTRYTVEELREGLLMALESRPVKGRTIMIAMTLIAGINDSIEEARNIALFIKPMLTVAPKIVVDLIPYNDVNVPGFSTPPEKTLREFQRCIIDEGLFCSIRFPRGNDNSAACGMLATKRIKPNQY